MIKTIASDRFEAEVLRVAGPLIVIFEASWCPFCREFKPTMERHEDDFPWPVIAVALDDTDDPLWDCYSVEVVPTLAVFEAGQSVFRIDGVLGVGLGMNDVERLRGYIGKRSISRS